MNCSRRQFLGACASSTLALGVAPLLANCTARRGAGSSRLQPGHLDPIVYQVLWHASLAPSGHNSQPWAVDLLPSNLWRIGIPPERRLPAVDPAGRETLISLGAFVENLTLAAAVHGLEAEVKVIAADSLVHDMIELRLVRGPVGSSEWLTRIQQRRVVKKGQRPELLRRADIRWLEGLGPGRVHFFPRGSGEANRLRAGAAEAMAMQCRREEAMGEMAQWVRFGEASVQAHRDGLTTEGMEIAGPAAWFLDHCYRHEEVRKDSFRRRTVDLTAKLAGEGGGWLLLSGNSNTPAELIETGRLLQRMLLQMRERDIACHPMSQLLEEPCGQNELASLFGPGHGGQMLLRMGYLDSYPDPVSPRRPPGWFVTG